MQTEMLKGEGKSRGTSGRDGRNQRTDKYEV